MSLLKEILGIILIISGIFDSIKYIWNAQAIKKVGTARGHSRKFINTAVGNDLIKIVYLIFINPDIFLIITSILALGCMLYLWYIIYIFYPYKYRNLKNWKRPNIFVYTINSLLPNNLRRRL